MLRLLQVSDTLDGQAPCFYEITCPFGTLADVGHVWWQPLMRGCHGFVTRMRTEAECAAPAGSSTASRRTGVQMVLRYEDEGSSLRHKPAQSAALSLASACRG
jgi:hypothetical protein